MIEKYHSNKTRDYIISEILGECKDKDFYLTEDNRRVLVDDIRKLKKLFKESKHIFFENNCYSPHKGLIMVWRSVSGDTKRNYIKLIANGRQAAERLLTNLFWNFKEQSFVKVRKDSRIINAYKSKGFKFAGGRGSQILLKRDILPYKVKDGKENARRH